MDKYVMKQVPVECEQLKENNVIQLFEWINGIDTSTSIIGQESTKKEILNHGLNIKCQNGLEITAKCGDWIIKNIKGEFAVCPNNIFQQSFELYSQE